MIPVAAPNPIMVPAVHMLSFICVFAYFFYYVKVPRVVG